MITEKDGWIFAEAPRAFAAVKVVDGGWVWAKPDLLDTRGIQGYDEQGRWAVFERESSPHVMEVVSKEDFASLAAFQDAILGNPIRRGQHGDRRDQARLGSTAEHGVGDDRVIPPS